MKGRGRGGRKVKKRGGDEGGGRGSGNGVGGKGA